MNDPLEIVDEAIEAAGRLRTHLGKSASAQIQASPELLNMKLAALAWVRTHRPALQPRVASETLKLLDSSYQSLLAHSARNPRREKVRDELLETKRLLVDLRTEIASDASNFVLANVSAPPPDWSVLIPDVTMQAILNRRWAETIACMQAGGYLSATVMMGAMLEAVLLARVLNNMAAAHTAATAPKDKKTGATRNLNDWTLVNYLEVAHELKWIRQAAKDIGQVLRNYRNYIHPHKEFSEGVTITGPDCEMFWPVFQSLITQIVAIAKPHS